MKQTNPSDLQILAKKTEKSTRKWITTFKKKNSGKLDDIVHNLHNDFFETIDCLQCANCCKTISPTLYNKDIERLSKTLKMKPSEFMDKYLTIDKENDYVFKQTPCPFLTPDNYCVVYENRPKACREYPHTNRPRFYQILQLTLKNTFVCPAAYFIMEQLKKELGNK